MQSEIERYTAANSTQIKERIIRYYIANGQQMIPVVAAETGYSVPTITKYIAELTAEGYIVDYGKTRAKRGRQPNVYGINPDSKYFVGVDIKNFGLSIGLMNLTGDMVDSKENRHFRFENTPASLEAICGEIKRFIALSQIDAEKIGLVNVNISGRVDSNAGYSYSIFNFEENDAPLTEILSERIGLQTMIENDTRAMTYGELIAGKGRQYRNFLFVNASWGIGLGIVINGSIYYGKDGYSGEMGHMNTYNNEIMCHCGKKGCLETEVSGRAVHRMLSERISRGESSILSAAIKSGEVITTNDIIGAANREDTLCIELIEQVGSELGRQLANMINIFNPEAVIIGGSLARAGEYFLPPIQLAIRKYSLKLISRHIAIETSALLDNAGVIGACMMARHKYLY